MRFRPVLTMVWDGGRFLEFWVRRADFLLRGWAGKDQLQMQLLGPKLGGSCTHPTIGSNMSLTYMRKLLRLNYLEANNT